MRNKDKRGRRRSRPSSPKLAKSEHFADGRKKHQGSATTQDDYGFLDRSRQHATKETLNEYDQHRKNGRNSSGTRMEMTGRYNVHQASQQNSCRPPSQNRSNSRTRGRDDLDFYSLQLTERRSRSTSRTSRQPPDGACDNSTTRRDRSRSKSRDIMALYTSTGVHRSRSATPVGSLRSYLYVPPATGENTRSSTPATTVSKNFKPFDLRSSTPNYAYQQDTYRRSRSLARDQTDRDSTLKSNGSQFGRRARSETRCSSRSRDAISLCSNMTTQSRALSNSEIASQNLELWMSTSAKTQRTNSLKRKKMKKKENAESFVTLLEMDPKINEDIEKRLNAANSVKPENIQMMVIAGHTPSENWESKDELKVESGIIVTGLYKQNEWLYVTTKNSVSGYVPYAYTKAVKITPLDENRTKTRSQQNQSSVPNVRYRTQPNQTMTATTNAPSFQTHSTPRTVDRQERDSLSSTNTALIEEIMCVRSSGDLRHIRQQPMSYADCLVVDNDKSDGLMEEDIRVCSDSGISEPNSNHSDELDGYVHLSKQHHHYANITTPGSRSSLESASPLENCRARRMYKQFKKSEEIPSQKFYHQPATQINTMPLGVLGERLQRHQHDDYTYEKPLYCNISQDMRSRAQPVSNIPAELKPKIPKDYNGPRARVAYDYLGQNEDDVVVRAGDVVTVLNSEDVEWIWVMRGDGVEGFMPREFVIATDAGNAHNQDQIVRHVVVSL